MAENVVTELKRSVGNYTGYANKSFPLDADGLNAMQINNALLSVLGNIGGNKYVLLGCEKTDNNWSAGYIFVATQKYPSGELLYVASGVQDTIYVNPITENITASGYEYLAAYTKRSCEHGTGAEQFNLTEFSKITTNEALLSRIVALESTIVTPEAIGSIKMWPVLTPPTGWLRCEGQALNKYEYSELYALMGSQHGELGDDFYLPNMKNRFPVGYNVTDGDYNVVGKIGGSKQHTLLVSEMPHHNHQVTCGWDRKGTAVTDDKLSYYHHSSGATISTSAWMNGEGGGQPFTHIPEYFTIPFIIKVK